ncbi:MAG: hypothetical protein ACRC6M_12925 [Microcystaceae cyanobacterium]
MLKQFRRQFPQGSFTSELLMVDHGLYLVRSLIQVEGVILSSGLAAAGKLEEAEDQARLRALEHLALDQISPTPSTVSASVLAPVTLPTIDLVPEKIAVNLSTEKAVSNPIKEEAVLSLPEPEPIIETVTPPAPKKQRAAKVVEAPKLEIVPEPIEKPVEKTMEKTVGKTVTEAIAPPELETPEHLELIETVIPEAVTLPQLELIPEPEPSLFPAEIESLEPEIIASSPVPPVPLPLSLEPTLTLEPETPASPVASDPEVTSPLPDPNQPIDFSEVIARSNVELKRLNWTNEQGKNYLLQTYGKRSRQLLSDEELLEFVLYLEAQPNPN